MSEPLDALDVDLLQALHDTPRAGVLELSRRLGVARGTVQARLDRMERTGVVTGYGPDVDVAAAGYGVQAFVTLEIAQGGSVQGLDPQPRGAAIQCRINAEDPGRNFLPGPGRITRYSEPGGPFVRVDSGVTQGREIPGDYDSMFAKVIVFGEDRERARRRMLRALDEFRVEGVPTTIPVHRWILQSADFRTSTHTTTWLERALVDANFPAQADIQPSPAGINPARPADILVEVDGLRVPGRIFDVRREVAPKAPASAERHDGGHVHGEIKAPMQGTILKVLIEKGQQLQAGDVICILEAMKMENHIASARDGEVTELPIHAGQVVETGQTLAIID